MHRASLRAGPRANRDRPGPALYGQCMSPVDRVDLRARVELALDSFLRRQRGVLADIDPALDAVAEAVEAFVLGGGKRLRPAFAYWGFRGAGGPDSDQIVAAVSALEFVQASALIHDDVMDASDTRRGEPSVHRRFAKEHASQGWYGDSGAFGAASAILLGDLCLCWSDELLRCSGVDAVALLRARAVFDLMRTQLIGGQYLDVHAQVTADTSRHRAGTVARYKSAKYTVEHPLLLGAALAGATSHVQAAYSAYGLPLGEAFQLRDDVLGVFGDPTLTGKPAGDDLREGKRTFLVAEAFSSADAATTHRLNAGLGDPRLDEAGVDALRQIIVDTGALKRTEDRIEQLTDAALRALSGVALANGADEVLVELASAATRRLL
jgi:geranylgeranyl diphosphate synthase, type I